MLLVDSKTVRIKGTKMNCKPIGDRHPLPARSRLQSHITDGGTESLVPLTQVIGGQKELHGPHVGPTQSLSISRVPALRALLAASLPGQKAVWPASVTQPWNSRESPFSVLLEPSPGLAHPSWEGICSFSFLKEAKQIAGSSAPLPTSQTQALS